MPGLDALLNLFEVIAQWEQDGSKPEGLLNQTLPVLRESLPAVAALRLDVVVGKRLLPVATTNEHITANGLTLDDVLQVQNPLRSLEGEIWQLPLRHEGVVLAVLEVTNKGTLDDDAPAFLELLAGRIASALAHHDRHKLSEKQVAFSAGLLQANNAVDIARLLGQTVVERGQFAVVLLLQYNPEKALIGFKTLASANRHEAYRTDVAVDISLDRLGAPLRRLVEQGEPVIIENIQDAPDMDETIKFWDGRTPLLAACALPLRDEQGEVFGLITINNVRGVLNVPPYKLYWLQQIADQVAVTLRSQQIIGQASQTRRLADQMLHTNRAITGAENDSEMSWAILQAMPPEIVVTALLLFDAPAPANEIPASAIMSVVTTRDSILHPDIVDVFDRHDLVLGDMLYELIEGQANVVEDSRQDDTLLLPAATRYLNDLGVFSFVMIGLRSGRRLLGLLLFGSPQSVRISTGHYDTILAIADQVAVTVENRNLLREKETSLNEIRTLYDVNRALIASADELDVLRALRQYLAEDAASIILVTLDWEGDTLRSMVQSAWIDQKGSEFTGERNLLEDIPPEHMNVLKQEWALQGRDVDIIEDVAAMLDDRPAFHTAYEAGVRSAVVIPVYAGEVLVQQVSINFARPRSFSREKRRLYDAIRDQITIVLENRRLLREAQRKVIGLGSQVRTLQTINELSVDLIASPDQQTLLDRTAEALYNALGVDHVGIVLAEPDNATGRVVSDYPDAGILGAKIDNTDLFQQRLRRRLEPIIVENVDDNDELTRMTRAVLQRAGTKSMLLLPLYDTQNHYIGSIGLDFYRSGQPFTPEMQSIAQAITLQVSVTLQNLRLLADARRQARQMEEIADLGRTVQATLDLPTLLQVALKNIDRIIEHDHAALVLYDPVRNVPRLAASQLVGQPVAIETDTQIIPAETPIAQVWATKTPLNIPDLHTRTDVRHGVPEMRSVMALPIFARGVVIGVVTVASREPHAYTALDNVIFQQFGGQVAVALENAEAYHESQRVARSKATAGDITGQLQRRMELDQLVGVTVNELGRALNARRGRIRIDPDAIPGGNGKKKS